MCNSKISRHTQWGPYRGFTLVELLVVIAIIGVLVALLLPAVQAAREAARRISCQNNLHNLGLAIHNYENQNGGLPAATEAQPLNSNITIIDFYRGNQLSWLVRILPQMEQQALYDQFDFDKTVFEQDINTRPEEAQPSPLLCPSDQAQGRFYESATYSNGKKIAKGNYAAYVSPEHGSAMAVFPGAFINELQPLRKVTDGTTNTIMLAEVRTRDVPVDQRGAWPMAWVGSTMLALDVHSETLNCGRTQFNTPRNSPFLAGTCPLDQATPPNLPAGQFNADDLRECTEEADADAQGMPCRPDSFWTVSPRSLHPGGVNAANVDASVRWLNDDVDVRLLAHLVSINDGTILEQ